MSEENEQPSEEYAETEREEEPSYAEIRREEESPYAETRRREEPSFVAKRIDPIVLDEEKDAEDEEEERERFLEEFSDNIYLYTKNFAERQQKWLSEAGFERTHQWDIFEKKTAEILIKPRSNESISHAYLIGAIKQFIQKEIDPGVKLYETKLPDLVFKVNIEPFKPM